MFALAGALLVAGAAAGAATNSVPASLAEPHRKRIAVAACGESAAPGASLLATAAKGSKQVTVDVRCPPHGALGRSALARVTTCTNARGPWRCEAGEEAILVKLPDSTVVPVIATGIVPLQAVVLVVAASKQLVPPFHTPASSMMRGQCRISPHPESPSPDMQQFDIRCSGTSMLLTKHCWSGGCSYFIPQGEGY